jgi:hypothetical protein
VPVSALDRAEQFAFWANLYNALTVRTVLDHFPVRSIRDVDLSPGLFSVGPRGAELTTVEGEPCRWTTSSTASCGRSGATRGSTTR